MKNILYIMNVDWNWIKQRPHFVAEELSKKFDIHVIYQFRYDRTKLQKREKLNFKIKPIYVIPKGDRYYLTKNLNSFIKKIIINKEIRIYDMNVMYLTFPNQIKYIPLNYSGKVIYDCMDNHPAFLYDETEKKELIAYEKKLIKRCDIVLVSSLKLKELLEERYGKAINSRIYLIRNGYDGKIMDLKSESIVYKKDNIFTFTYFGTIGKWFNFNYILKSLEDFKNIKYELFGPIDGGEIPKHNRLIYKGILEHNQLFRSTKNADCFIMPFIVNEIIESVDPVKLYEYINFNKHIICCKYPEVERFGKFVDFYTDYGSFRRAVKTVQNRQSLKYCNEDRINFLKENSWENRVNKIGKIITG